MIPSFRPFVPALAAALAVAASSCASSNGPAPRREFREPWDAVPLPAAVARETPVSGFAAKQGFFVSGLGAYSMIQDGDFDGETILGLPTGETAFMPELESGSGFGGSIGWRGVANSAQLTFTRTEHDEDPDRDVEDQLDCFSLDFKHYWRIDSRFQPHVLFGITVPRLLVEDGAMDAALNVDDGRYQGLGLNLGTGAHLYLTSRIALILDVYYRWAYVDEFSGAGVTREIQGDQDISGFAARGGLSFTF
jgi:hypothetical protein